MVFSRVLFRSRSSRSFDPRLRAGGDASGIGMAFTASGFDPRLRAGGDSTGRRASTHWRSFDPRLRAGGDVLQFVSDDPARVSIHASAQEATLYGREKNRRLVVSIHASAQEATIGEIGRASWRERVCQYGEISVVEESLKKQKKKTHKTT